MNTIPLNIFYSFKSQAKDIILLFNKEIKNKLKKKNNLKQNQTILNLYLNKVNNDNYLVQCKKFLGSNYIEKNKFNEMTEEFFQKIISEDKFTENYLLFYKTIIENYYNETKYDFSYFINLVESKFLIDFENKKVLLQNIINKLTSIPKDLTEKELENYVLTFKINNLRIIHFLIKHNILDCKINKYIYNILLNNQNHEFLYNYLKLNEDLDFIKSINFDNMNLRFKTLFNELILNLEKNNKLETNHYKKDENIKNFKDNKLKVSHKTLIKNIIEEYLFIDEIEEVKVFIENYILKKNLQILFVETALNYGKTNNKEEEIVNMLELVKETLKKKSVVLSENL